MATINLEGRYGFLAGHPMFGRLPPPQLRTMAGVMGEQHHPVGSVIFQEHDPAEHLFLIVSGVVRIEMLSPEGTPTVVNMMKPNEIFGEIALLDNKTRTAGAVAQTDCLLLTLSRNQFMTMLTENSQLAAAIFLVLVERLRHMSDLLQNLTFRGSRGRVAYVVGQLADRVGKKGREGIEIERSITQEQIGSIADTSRATVNKELGYLEGLQLIRRRGKQIIVLDRAGLTRTMQALPTRRTQLM